MPCARVEDERPVSTECSLDSGSGVATILGKLLARMQAKLSGVKLTRLFKGHVRVMAAMGEERDVDTQCCGGCLTVESSLKRSRSLL